MKKILLPTDFSGNAYNAIEYAVRLLKDEECVFYLLNTFTPILYDSEYVLYSTSQPGLEDIYRENSEKNLEKIKKRLIHTYKNSRHEFKIISAFNLLVEEISEQVQTKKIDLVVMGTQGATGTHEVLMGTNTVQAINKVKCQLLAIPSEYQYRSPEHILFPTDYELEYTAVQFQLLREIIKNYGAKLHVLHVKTGKPLNPEQEKAKEILEQQIMGIEHQFYIVEKQSISRAVYDFQNKHAVDMLVMINNKHSFFENLFFRPVVNRIGFQAKVPFLVIPSGKYS